MENTEIRIGNMILNDGVVNEVVGLLCDGVATLKTPQGNFIHGRYELIKGVPLTEDFLSMLGFGNVIPNSHGYKNTYGRNGERRFVFVHDCDLNIAYFDFKMTADYGSQQFRHELRYVHQLQNLYFALTGSELTIKLTHDTTHK